MNRRAIGDWFGAQLLASAGDVVSSVVDSIPGAAKILGAALNAIAPIVSMFPGIGTAVSVAFSAAAAVALGTPIDDALIGAASNAIPGGLPRIGFDSAVAMSKDALAGRNAFGSAVEGMRAAAQQAGGDRARQAFDAGLGVARGQKVSQQAIDAARAQAALNGTQALAAFDASVAVAKGEGASGAALAAGRDYIAATGNPLALAAFDTGIALAHGQALQDAGFAGFQSLVAGNDSAARAVRYLRAMNAAREQGRSVWTQLVTDLRGEVGPLLGNLDVKTVIGPLVDALRLDPSLLAWSSQALADAWGEAEPLVRAAQAIMRDGERPDASLAAQLQPIVLTSKALDTSVTSARAQAPVIASPVAASINAASFPVLMVSPPPAVVVPSVKLAPFLPAKVVLTQATKPREAPSSAAANVAIVGGAGVAVLAALWYVRS